MAGVGILWPLGLGLDGGRRNVKTRSETMKDTHGYYKKAQYECAKDKKMHRGPSFLYYGKPYCVDCYMSFFKKPDTKQIKESYVQTTID